ncbi:hypothetical protein J437_LFUL019194 [Ladona fulva]|uniref:Methyltransferase-like protein 17, mitochondrial n=1 Tax=Ladona fulva TaxID=123851 RepID=A0A8K0KSD5_LADFU|nr:hypothetical protein J437_LFUL019194 [Ladona fulva]
MNPAGLCEISCKFKSFDSKFLRLFTYSFRKFATKSKLIPSLDGVNEETNPKKHPGIMALKSIEVPNKLLLAITNVFKDQPISVLSKNAELLRNYLHSRKPPLESGQLRQLIGETGKLVEQEDGIDLTTLTDEEKAHLSKIRKSKVKKIVNQKVYNWSSIRYDDQSSRTYLLARSAAEFAVLFKVFSEIKLMYPNFSPKTLFDFGSGIGTVSWAAWNSWKTLKEYFCVDSSKEMLDLADLILRNGNLMNDHIINGVYFRQFLPSSQTLKYDLTVSAYSMMDLPSSKNRFETLLNLWNKSSGFLILIENGTKAGFEMINEARDFILEISRNDDAGAHVVSPCPHNFACPKIGLRKPCTFPVKYYTLPIGGERVARNEIFSYVVLKKGCHAAGEP